MEYTIVITRKEDYFIFFRNYIDSSNKIKSELKGSVFIFKVKFEKEENIDEQILFDYYLISNKFSNDASFYLKVYLPEEMSSKSSTDAYFRLSRYGLFQEIKSSNSRIVYGNQIRKFAKHNLNGIMRLMPVFSIDGESMELLRSGITFSIWSKIRNSNDNRVDILEDAVYRICWRLLFSKVGVGNKELSALRCEAFESDSFFKLISGIPLIALLIFAMLDYSFREDAVEHYKMEIRKKEIKKGITLHAEDFLYEKQSMQTRENFEANNEAAKKNYDNKTIWASYERMILHSFIIKEMYEAITISEGIIQLLENIVYHAGEKHSKGKGLLGIYIRNFESDKRVFESKYPEYVNYCQENKINSKYYLELFIADLSGTNIPQKFMDNNVTFINQNEEKIKEKMIALGGTGEIPKNISLGSFFKPQNNEVQFWTAFFSFPDKAVNHYGLQIFDSIISTKGGLFAVESGKERYCNMFEARCQKEKFHGSKYSVICPLNGYSSSDTNIYDSMLGYNYNIQLKPHRPQMIEGNDIEIPHSLEEKQEYIGKVLDLIENSSTDFFCINLRSFSSIECTIKAILLYIFKEKEEDLNKEINIAFLHCETYQIINIVRIISLYYNKQGNNIKMKNVQIYVRGERIGEEILFLGETLQEVKCNIAKCVCMRGTMFDNLQAVNKVLERSEGKENEQ